MICFEYHIKEISAPPLQLSFFLLLRADKRNDVLREQSCSAFNVIDQISTSDLRELNSVFVLKDQENTDDPRPSAPWKESWIGVASPFTRVDTLHTTMKDGKINVNIADMQQAPVALLVFDHGIMVSTIPDLVLAHKNLVHPCLGSEITSWAQDHCPFVASSKES